jgi:antitoxin MazE
MRTQVSKWGNSLALRIPGPMAKELAIEDGRAVELTLDRGKLVVAPIAAPSYDICDLVAQMKRGSEHEEIATGKPRGNEAW